MTSRLQIYNGALTKCGERSLASLSENRESRHKLDTIWNNGGVKACLERGQWRFALRTVMVDYDTAVTPEFGYRYAFAKPTDLCTVVAFSDEEYLNNPLLAYRENSGYWYADVEPVYVEYVSDHADYGGDLSLWPEAFTQYVEAHFAARIILSVTSDEKKQASVMSMEKSLLKDAKNLDAMQGPEKILPDGGWVRARHGGRTGRRDRGSRTRFTG